MMPSASVSAFDLRPDPVSANGAAALCLHGLTGTPYEVEPIANALVARGIRARGPWMAGHEAGPEALADTTHKDWLELARDELFALLREHDRVFLVGVSMGGLVSLRLAQEAQQIAGIVVVGTPLVLGPPIPQLLPWVRPFKKFRKKRASGIREPAARARHPGLSAMPLSSVAQLIELGAIVAENLARIHTPILVAHGALDRTARPRDAERIHAEVGSKEKELFLLPRSDHVATVDYDGPVLARAAADFLARR